MGDSRHGGVHGRYLYTAHSPKVPAHFGNGSSSYAQAPEFYVVKEPNIDLDGTNTLDGLHATAAPP